MSRRIKVWHVSNNFHYAGTERAMGLWVQSLDPKVFEASAFSRQGDGPQRLALEKAGIRAKVLGYDLEVWKAAFKKGPPDIMHTHRHGEEDPAWAALNTLARAQGVRVIVETNVFGERRQSEGPASPDVMGYMSAFCLWRYAHWPAHLPQDHLGPHAVFYNPLNLDLFPSQGFSVSAQRAARKFMDIPNDAIVAGRIGRPDPNKWSNWFMGALATALRQEPNLHLVFMEAPAGAEQEARQLGIDERCRFLKASAKAADVTRFYASLDVLAHSSRVGESFGYTLAEAMAWGIPVLVDSTPWADNAQIELVGHNAQGLVAGRPASFTEALLRLSRDSALRQRLGQSARAEAARFEVGALTRSLEGVYARALVQQGHPSAALARMAARPTSPSESWVKEFGALYAKRLNEREMHSAWADGLWALNSRVRLYGRGWISKTFNFWPFSWIKTGLRRLKGDARG